MQPFWRLVMDYLPMKYFTSSYMDTWNSNLVHERDNCVTGREVGYIPEVQMKMSPLVSAGISLALFLQGIRLIISHIWRTSLHVSVNCVCHVSTGLNGRPVCMVRDDWFVTSSLFPHPLLKSHGLKKVAGSSFTFLLSPNLSGVSGHKNKSGMFTCIHGPHYFSEALLSGNSSQLQNNESDFPLCFNSTIFRGLEGWT